MKAYRSIGDLNFGLLMKDGLLKLEVDANEKPIPIKTYDPKDDVALYFGQLNEKNELHGIGRCINVARHHRKGYVVTWEISEG